MLRTSRNGHHATGFVVRPGSTVPPSHGEVGPCFSGCVTFLGVVAGPGANLAMGDGAYICLALAKAETDILDIFWSGSGPGVRAPPE